MGDKFVHLYLQMNAETSTQRPVIRLEIPKKSKNDAKKSEMPAALNQNEGRTVVLVKSVLVGSEKNAMQIKACRILNV